LNLSTSGNSIEKHKQDFFVNAFEIFLNRNFKLEGGLLKSVIFIVAIEQMSSNDDIYYWRLAIICLLKSSKGTPSAKKYNKSPNQIINGKSNLLLIHRYEKCLALKKNLQLLIKYYIWEKKIDL
jgi:DNA polymerase sigma